MEQELLIVVDMQNDFIDGSLGTKEALEIVAPAEEKIKNFKGDIIYTRDTHFENYLDTSEGKKLPVKHCIKGTQGWNINERIFKAGAGRVKEVIDKPTFGSLYLAEKVLKEGYEKITLIGLCTDICVVSNALILKAYMPETEIFVESRLCAGVTPQSHKSALETMHMCQINVI